MALSNRRSNQVNDLDLSNWQQYEDILTDSLWILDSRDSSGAHQADYHGNFVPQIPNQLLRRFTKPAEVVLDPFIGSGTTAIEANRLGRQYIGVELSASVANQARQRIMNDINTGSNDLMWKGLYDLGEREDLGILCGDSGAPHVASEIRQRLDILDLQQVHFLIMHPPYHNIIQFSENTADLSNCQSVHEFVHRFMNVYNNLSDFLEPGRHLAIVIGDIYQNGEWIPLQNLITHELLNQDNLRLKSIIVKNMVNNRAKRNLEHLWRYRALANGFYIFKHEYVVLFQKNRKIRRRNGSGQRKP